MYFLKTEKIRSST